MTRYILHPGEIRSQSDGQFHYIGAGALRDLYRLPHDAKCVVAGEQGAHRDHPGDIHLYPRWDGDYRLSVGRDV